jgi:hypothetical protein
MCLLFLSDFNNTEMCGQILEKIPNTKVDETLSDGNRSVPATGQTDRQTDRETDRQM